VTADILVKVGWLSRLVILADKLPGKSAVGIASASAFVAMILPLTGRGQTAHPE
jgi:hypothetical protein